MIKRKCVQCGNAFETTNYFISKGQGRFCSRKCYYKNARKGVRKKCDGCNKQVYRNVTQIKRSKSGKFFCSKSCQTVWRNKHYSKEKHTRWKGGEYTYRRLLKNTDTKIACLRCGTSDRRILAVHHKDGDHSHNSVENLCWLCHNCHALVHADSQEFKKILHL